MQDKIDNAQHWKAFRRFHVDGNSFITYLNCWHCKLNMSKADLIVIFII
jgi:hypothetical protein